ncbi:MAG: hypothetical protein JSS53_01145 [Proteobacteria bacterium]|nr:hypothetical protein [Pseudomonadota bacterium]
MTIAEMFREEGWQEIWKESWIRGWMEGWEKGWAEGWRIGYLGSAKEIAIQLLKMGKDVQFVSEVTNLPISELQQAEIQ